MTRRRTLMLAGLLFGSVMAAPFFSFAQISSDSFEVEMENGTTATHHSVSSTSYDLDGSIEPIAGRGLSSSYILESGSGFSGYCGDGFIDPAEDCDTGTYGGVNLTSCSDLGYDDGNLTCSSSCQHIESACSNNPGGESQPDNPQDASRPGVLPEIPHIFGFPPGTRRAVLPYTYLGTRFIAGTRGSESERILVSGSESGVKYRSAERWDVRRRLIIGLNLLVIRARSNYWSSPEVTIEITRRETGDVNGDTQINDADLSLFSRRFGTSAKEADFNEDGLVDDYDLSIFVAKLR